MRWITLAPAVIFVLVGLGMAPPAAGAEALDRYGGLRAVGGKPGESFHLETSSGDIIRNP